MTKIPSDSSFKYKALRSEIIANTNAIEGKEKQLKKLTGAQRELMLNVFKYQELKKPSEEMKTDLLALQKKLSEIAENPKSHKRKTNLFSWISRIYKNCFKDRIRSSELVDLLTTISNKPEKLQKQDSLTQDPILQDPRLVLPKDMLYKIVADIPIKNDADIRDSINMMKVLWLPQDKDKPCVLGTIDAELLAEYVLEQKISIAKLHLSDQDSKILFPPLRYLDLKGASHSQLKLLESCSHVEHLSLACFENISDADLKKIVKNHPNIKSLNLMGCNLIKDEGLEHLKDLKSLTWLDLSKCKLITDKGLEHLQALTNLTVLNLCGCRSITDNGLEHLRVLTNLAELNLSFCQLITNKGLEHLRALTNLTELELYWCNLITDKGFEHLKALTSLSALNLIKCNLITDKGLKRLKELTSITALNLSGCELITDKGLKHLKALTSLSVLMLSSCHLITDKGLEHLKVLTNLTVLDLCGSTSITDNGLEHLKVLTNLSALDLSWGQLITDNGLEHLKALTNLKTLSLSMCKRITDKGLKYFKKKAYLDLTTP